MARVRRALREYDVHPIISGDDQIVEPSSSVPPDYSDTVTINTGLRSPLRRHFLFAQMPSVLQTVVDLLRDHIDDQVVPMRMIV